MRIGLFFWASRVCTYEGETRGRKKGEKAPESSPSQCSAGLVTRVESETGVPKGRRRSLVEIPRGTKELRSSNRCLRDRKRCRHRPRSSTPGFQIRDNSQPAAVGCLSHTNHFINRSEGTMPSSVPNSIPARTKRSALSPDSIRARSYFESLSIEI